jgi:RNA polymerase sigma-70 factor (ECF subfamily)
MIAKDKLLILKFKLGSKDALQKIFEKYKNDLLKLAVALTGDVNPAEDVVQDVFVSFIQSATRIGLRGSLKRYLITSVVNRTRNLKRDLQRHGTLSIEGHDCIACDPKRPEQWAILSEELKLLSEAMAQIPYEQREVISLYMQGHMTFRQIANLQNASIKTIQGRYRYGLDKLRSILNSTVRQ